MASNWRNASKGDSNVTAPKVNAKAKNWRDAVGATPTDIESIRVKPYTVTAPTIADSMPESSTASFSARKALNNKSVTEGVTQPSLSTPVMPSGVEYWEKGMPRTAGNQNKKTNETPQQVGKAITDLGASVLKGFITEAGNFPKTTGQVLEGVNNLVNNNRLAKYASMFAPGEFQTLINNGQAINKAVMQPVGDKLRETGQKFDRQNENNSALWNNTLSTAESLGRMGADIPMSIASGLPTPAIMGLTNADETYNENVAKGMDPKEALVRAAVSGAIEGGSEYALGGETISKVIKGQWKELLAKEGEKAAEEAMKKTLGHKVWDFVKDELLAESGQEAGTEVLHDAADTVLNGAYNGQWNDGRTLKEDVSNALWAGYGGALMGAIGGGAGIATKKILNAPGLGQAEVLQDNGNSVVIQDESGQVGEVRKTFLQNAEVQEVNVNPAQEAAMEQTQPELTDDEKINNAIKEIDTVKADHEARKIETKDYLNKLAEIDSKLYGEDSKTLQEPLEAKKEVRLPNTPKTQNKGIIEALTSEVGHATLNKIKQDMKNQGIDADFQVIKGGTGFHKDIQKVMKSLGVEVVFYKGDKVPNGFISNSVKNTIFIHSSGERNDMVATTGHEFLHHVKKTYAGEYKELLNFAKTYFTKEAKENFLKTYSNVPELMDSLANDEDSLLEEMLADEMGNNFMDKNFWQRVYEHSRELFEKLVEVATKIVKNFSSADKYETYVAKETAETLSKKFEETVASVRKQVAEGKIDTEARILEENGIQLSKEKDSLAPISYNVRTYTSEAKKKIVELAEKNHIAEAEETYQYLKALDNVMATIIADADRLDYEESNVYKALKNNSDPHYKESVDFTTLCRKRIILQGTIEKIQSMLGRGLTQDEWIDTRRELNSQGIEVSCGACYVDTRRMEMGLRANQYIEKNINQKQWYGHDKIKKNVPYPEKLPPKSWFYTQEGLDKMKEEYPEIYTDFNSKTGARGIKAPESRTAYRGEVLNMLQARVDALNSKAGLRWQSWSDFEVPHLLDGMQVIADMFAKGLKGHAYTKVENFVRAFGKTGMMINMSLIPKGKGLDADGNLSFDSKEGMPFETTLKYREDYPGNVGNVTIGVNDDFIRAAMRSPEVDYIIPYHKSGLSLAKRTALGIGMEEWSDYERVQNPIPRNKEAKANAKKLPDIYDVWDYNKTPKENADAYIEELDKLGYNPPFPQFTNEDNYWKVLIDHKMVNQLTGENIIQHAVKPDFDEDVLQNILSEYKGEHNEEQYHSPTVDKLVEQFSKRTRSTTNSKLTMKDATKNDTKLSTRSKEFKQWFGDSKVVDENGEPLVVYHGTSSEFEGFDKNKRGQYTGAMSAKEGFYFTNSQTVADTYREGEYDLKPVWEFINSLEPNQLIRLAKNLNYGGILYSDDADEDFEFTKDNIKNMIEDLNKQEGLDGFKDFVKQAGYLGEYFNPKLWSKVKESYEKGYGHRVEAYLKMENPLDIPSDEAQAFFNDGLYTDTIKKAKTDGHDGVIFRDIQDSISAYDDKNPPSGDIYIAFEPEQIMFAKGKYASKVFESENTSNLNYLFNSQNTLDSQNKSHGMKLSIRSKQFKDWFADSKVTDEEGNPKVIYHGTSNAGFNMFDTYGSNYGLFGQGSYFTEDTNIASQYIEKGRGKAKGVYPVYARVEFPLDMDKPAKKFMWEDMFPDIDFDGITTNESAYRKVEEWYEYEEWSKWDASEDILDRIQDAGYDGITHIGGGRVKKSDGIKHRVWITFEPNQVKSAIGNNGEYSNENPDIRFAAREKESKLKGEYDPSGTSLNQIPALFKNEKVFKPSGVNADVGGGKYDLASEYLKENRGVENKVFDTFSRKYNFNKASLDYMVDKKIPTTTANNVLNVIKSKEDRLGVIAQSAAIVDKDGTSYFLIYEAGAKGDNNSFGGDGISPNGSLRGKGDNTTWQNVLKAEAYIPEIKEYYGEVTRSGNILIAKKPLKEKLTKAILDHQGEQHRTNEDYIVFDGSGGQHNLWDWYKKHEDAVNNIKLSTREKKVEAPKVKGRILKTQKGSVIKRYKNIVGKEIGGQLYLHRKYIPEIIPKVMPEDIYEKALKAFETSNQYYDFNTIVYEPKTQRVRFDEAPDFDTAREPIPGRNTWVNPDGTIDKTNNSKSIWHHKWLWVEDDYRGFDVDESYNWSKHWLENLPEKAIGIQARWQEQLDANGIEDSYSKYSVREKERRHHQRYTEADATAPELLERLTDESKHYEPISIKATWNEAYDEVKSDIKHYRKVVDQMTEFRTAKDVATAEAVLYITQNEASELKKKGSTELANDMFDLAARIGEKIDAHFTKAGQVVSMGRLWKALGPEATIRFIRKKINNQRTDKQNKRLENETKELLQAIKNLSEEKLKEIKTALGFEADDKVNSGDVVEELEYNRENYTQEFNELNERVKEVSELFDEIEARNASKIARAVVGNLKDVLASIGSGIKFMARGMDLNNSKSMSEKLSELIEEHYSKPLEKRGNLVEKIVKALGISGQEADKLASRINETMKDVTRKEKLKALAGEETEKEIKNKIKKALGFKSGSFEEDKLTEEQRGWIERLTEKALEGDLTKDMLKEAFAARWKIPFFSGLMAAKVMDLSEAIQGLEKGTDEYNIAVNKLNDYMNHIIKHDIWEHINTVENLAMLSGTKSMSRNVIGNVGRLIAYDTEKFGTALLDMGRAKFSKDGKRTVMMPNLKAQAKGVLDGIRKDLKDFRYDTDSREAEDGREFAKYIKYSNKPMNIFQRWVKLIMSDRPFTTAMINEVVSEAERLARKNGVKFDAIEAKQIAEEEAARTFFNGEDVVINRILQIRRLGNFGESKAWGIGSVVLKFAKVPYNISKFAIEREWHLAALKILYRGISTGYGAFKKQDAGYYKDEKFDSKAFLQDVTKGINGALIMYLGTQLFALGFIHVRPDDDDKDKKLLGLEKLVGTNKYQLNLSAVRRYFIEGTPTTELQENDLLATLDWFTPLSILMIAGIKAQQVHKEKILQPGDRQLAWYRKLWDKVIEPTEGLAEGIMEQVNTVLEMPMLQSLNKFKYSDSWQEGLVGMLRDIPARFIPAPVKYAKEAVDNTQRETYSDSGLGQTINQVKAKLPGLSKGMEPKIGMLGSDLELYQNAKNNFLNIAINPAIVTRYKTEPESKKMLDVYQKFGIKEQIPTAAPKQFIAKKSVFKELSKDESIILTAPEYRYFQQEYGKGVKELLGNFEVVDSKELQQKKANKLSQDYEELRDRIKKIILQKRGLIS